MKTYSVVSLGCKVNDYEATYIDEQLSKKFKRVKNDNADIFVIMSCCVTNTAEAKTRKYINRIRRENPKSFICVVGCYSQIKTNNPVFENVDLIVGSKDKNKVPSYIFERIKGNLVKDNKKYKFESMFINEYPDKSRAFLKIQDGCNQFCSYCIIPYARGNERSENHNKIIKNAKVLSKKYKEIVLTGIHTGRYNDGEYNLYDLLSELNTIKELETIRLSSIEINELTDEIIDLIAKSNRIAHHLHIPVQSLNNSILKSMNRHYTIEQFKKRVNYIRKMIPDISISTDLIVGFAGESEEIFNTFFKQLDIIKFSFIHVFPYSIKDGTKAAQMKGQVDEHIKKERVNKIIKYQSSIMDKYKRKFIKKYQEVLIEKTDNEYSYGYSKNYMYSKIKGQFPIGDIVKVKYTDYKDNIMIGEYVS